jgi:transcriptional regulator with XRE-family HTH domain
LAKLAGVKLDTVARIERGLHRLRVTTAALIFHALGRKLGDEMDTREQEIFSDSGSATRHSAKQDYRCPRHPCFDSG